MIARSGEGHGPPRSLQALRWRERLGERIQRMAHVGGWELELGDLQDVNRNALRWSDETYRIFGYEPGEVEVTNALFFDAVLPEDRPRIQEAVEVALQTGAPYEIEHRIQRADGTVRVLHEWAEIAADDRGTPMCMIGTCQDVTEMKTAEAEMLRLNAELEERVADFMVLMESIPVPVTWGHDSSCGRITGNRAFHELVGGAPGDNVSLTCDAPNRTYGVLDHGQPLPGEQLPLQRVAATGEPLKGIELELALADGTRRTIYGHAAPLVGRGKKTRGALFAFIDITEVRRAEQTMRAASEELKAADRRKDEFLATLAHELRNPLAPIRNAVEILRMKAGDNHEIKKCNEMIARQVQLLVRMVDDLLDVSRITRGRIALEKKRVELAEIFDRAVETSRPAIETACQTLEIVRPDGPVILEADGTRLAQVLSNLLNNAAKYTPRGGHIRLAAECGEGGLCLSVKDNGIGIPAEKLGSIFEMFSQVDTSLERAQGGLGIGLTIARRLVEIHGGTIEAHSEGLGKGTELLVRLPYSVASCPVGQENELRHDRSPADGGAGPKILVVDDNRDAAESMSMLLELSGCRVRVAGNGPEALRVAGEYRPELVFLDIGMPGMNGFDVARALRGMKALDGVVLVALTGWGQEEDRQKAREAGFDHHFTKPIAPEAIDALVEQMRSRSRS